MDGDKNNQVSYKELTTRTKERYKEIKELLKTFNGKRIANVGTNKHLNEELKQTNTTFIENIYVINTIKEYDLIICTSVLPHLGNTFEAMKNINKLLDKNGLLFLTVNNDISLYKRIKGIKFTKEDYHYALYDEETIINLLKDTGFKINKTEYIYESKYQKLLGHRFCGDLYFYCNKKVEENE